MKAHNKKTNRYFVQRESFTIAVNAKTQDIEKRVWSARAITLHSTTNRTR